MNIAVAQSGGPTCAINSSLLGVFKGAVKSKEIDKVYGSLNGIEGIIKDNLVVLNDLIKTYEDMESIKQTPSTLLCSCRYKLPDASADENVYKTIAANLKKHDIGAFFYIGGNDSMDTVNKVSAYFKANNIDIKVMGVPKTIDNDLAITDHTPGYGSAAKYVATTVQEIVRDCSVYDINSVTIIEIMGRDTGWLTAASICPRVNGDAAPDLVYLPEVEFSVEEFVKDVKEIQKTKRTVVVAISEGVEINDANDSDAFRSGAVDNFGHKYLSGVGKALENIVKRDIGCKVRSIELNLMQRCASHISSKTDIDEAERIGTAAVEHALMGETGKVMAFERISNNPYAVDIKSVDANKIANAIRYFPLEWINDAKNDIKPEALEYILPLIQGEQNLYFKNGMPLHFKRIK